ncbi:MAG: hypothetical protein RIC14_05830 [Filomicrobium sp.]
MQLNVKSIAFNGFVAIFLAAGAIYLVRSLFVTEIAEPCSHRIGHSTELVLDKNGRPLTPAELVAAIGASQRKIYDNAKVVRVGGIPGGKALKIALKNKGHETGEPGKTNGIGFLWAPRSLEGAQSACLSYSVYLPKDFDYGGGGVLPGLYAGTPMKLRGKSDGETSAAMRAVWRNNNLGNLYAQLPGYEVMGGAFLSPKGFKIDTGRWVLLEQELVLNAPGVSDGVARLWVDGELAVEKKWLNWRNTDKLSINGVMADVGFGMPQRVVSPPKDFNVYLSPLQLRWQ